MRSGADEWRPGRDYRPGAAPADPDASLGAPARGVAGWRPPLGILLAAHPTCDCRVHRDRHLVGLRLCCDDPAATASDRGAHAHARPAPDFAGLDRQACGGTHLSSTGGSPPIRILKIDNKGRHNRRVRIALSDAKRL